MASPIPIFPKPLAVVYNHLGNHYTSHPHDGTRLAASNEMISALLSHQFSEARFVRQKLNGIASPISSLPDDPADVTYWAVTLAPTTDGNHPVQENISPRKTPIIPPSLPLLTIIATGRKFTELKDRTTPTKLQFAPSAIGADGAFHVGENSWRKGYVMVFTARSRPVSPHFEMYKFDVDGEDAQCLVPWLVVANLDTNRVSFKLESAGMLNELFKVLRGI